jgi:hypothetical protein
MRLTKKQFLLLSHFRKNWKWFAFKTLEKFDNICTVLSMFLTRLITLSYVIGVDENSMRELN